MDPAINQEDGRMDDVGDDWKLVYDDDDEQRENEKMARRANSGKVKKDATKASWFALFRDMCNHDFRYTKWHPANGTAWKEST
jgi:hypothetical protein